MDSLIIIFFSTELFGKADDASTDAPRHSQAIRSVSEVVTIGILTSSKASASAYAIPGSRTATVTCFPKLPERTRLFRRLHTQQYWTGRFLTGRFLAEPALMGISDSCGIELRHPIPFGRKRAAALGNCPEKAGSKRTSPKPWASPKAR